LLGVDQARPYHGTPRMTFDGDTWAVNALIVSLMSYSGPVSGEIEPAMRAFALR
jgi:hypothetical protein